MTLNKSTWTVNSVESYKSIDPDGSCPKFLQQEIPLINQKLATYAIVWRQARMIFLVNSGQECST